MSDLSVFQNFYVYTKDQILACTKERPKTPVVMSQPWNGPMRAGDEFNRVHRIDEVLALLGFTQAHTDGQGVHWTRPGKEVSQGTSATVYHDAPDRVTVFSSTCTDMWPSLEVNHPYDAFGLLVVTKYGGDFSMAAEDLRDLGFGTETDTGPSLIDELGDYLADIAATMDAVGETVPKGDESTNGWDVVDLSDPRYGVPPPPPDLFERSDGVNLLYRGRIHYFYGKSESGKSWAAQVATVWTLQKGRSVVYIDFENDAWSVRERFEALGLDLAKTKHLLSYCSPNGPYTPIQWETFKKNLKGAELVIIDGVSDGMSMFGQDPLLNSDAVKFDRGFLRPLTSFGAAVVAIDHTPKSTEGPAAVFGAQHKKAAVTGAMFECRVKSPFGRGMVGTLTMRLEKDKPGYMRQHTLNGIIAELTLTSHTDGSVDAELNPPGSGGWRPTIIMENFSFYLERHAGITAQELNTQGTHIQDVNGRKRSIEILLKEGYIIKDLHSRFFSRKPYRKDDEGRASTAWAPVVPPVEPPAVFQTTFEDMGLDRGVPDLPKVPVPGTLGSPLTPVQVDREQELQDYLSDPGLAFSDLDDMDLT